ncbi:RagB/SusD family nutrient uptake outer membrane protein [Paraflavitalea sp. CAU 1676]|uniref:RagB/SusD family nutrient uptake outer membrane protein n=1 Tax=Paraflavitalea sp. CAU 1676 TaxID=3032598 RepID=UPI0023DC5819|nr:RagB/SusD family nutrient uptake outer membrane protein [Paraflavitalea sp. CAU 1676]MDF2192622.1 RagB/SusD family nutrient uptake outer membrane protein [Paraflavitalea sp. CAU 1676]
MRLFTVLLLTGLLAMIACNKLTDVDEPPGRYTHPFRDNITANQVMLGIYEKNLLEQGLYFGHLSRFGGLQGGELALLTTQGDEADFQYWRLKAMNRHLSPCWTPAYTCIARCNGVLAELPDAPGVEVGVKKYLLGEARFWRALSYFYLVNLWDHVPMVTGTDIGANAQEQQSSPVDVNKLVVADLEAALDLLPTQHPGAVPDSLRRTRIELGAARALLARVHLYLGHYAEAAHYASLVIESGTYALAPLDSVFHYQSRETIFQLKPVLAIMNTAEGGNFLAFTGVHPNYELTAATLTSFVPGDGRLAQWTKTVRVGNQDRYQPFKYQLMKGQPRHEYSIVLRLAEQYLIRAEARVQLGDLAGAQTDITTVRRRAAPHDPVTAVTADSLLAALIRERQAELFTEWGHRYFDLKRWWQLPAGFLHSKASTWLMAQPGWAAYRMRWPIPQQELRKNLQLQQNEQY